MKRVLVTELKIMEREVGHRCRRHRSGRRGHPKRRRAGSLDSSSVTGRAEQSRWMMNEVSRI